MSEHTNINIYENSVQNFSAFQLLVIFVSKQIIRKLNKCAHKNIMRALKNMQAEVLRGKNLHE